MSVIGVNVVETPGRSAPGLVAASTSVAGFVVFTTLGPELQLVEVTSLSGFLKVFGTSPTGRHGATALKGFFDNGGSRAKVVGLKQAEPDGSGESMAEVEARLHTAAIDLFERTDIQLLVLPETADYNVATYALGHCSKQGDRIYLAHLPKSLSVADAKTAGQKLSSDVAYGAAYFPWIRAIGADGKPTECPPCGHVAGVYARTAQERGIWKAPAGNAAILRGALDVQTHLSDVEHTDLVQSAHTNAIRALPGRGIVIDSARSLSSNTKWLYINVRLLMNFIKSTLKDGLSWAKYEPNDAALWGRIKHNTIVPFLMGLWRRGAFGAGKPEDLFTVVVDATNNLTSDVEQGLLNVDLSFYPSRPAETITISIGQQDAGAQINER